MFCFAGLVGMGIESKRIRKWLASSTFSMSHSEVPREAIEEPTSYIASFNPFPALVIGVTGAAMAAHAQTYLFQVRNLLSNTFFSIPFFFCSPGQIRVLNPLS